ncbi:hypothetical protein [Rhizobium sp. RCC_161_2]|uniref:hypothetical protein n=1 Tax=Rhizobium sp. RCC_161_2 TaxID=3239219 RepID=UPI0035232A96
MSALATACLGDQTAITACIDIVTALGLGLGAESGNETQLAITEPAEDNTDRLNAAGFGLATRLPERPHWRKSGLSFMSSRMEPIVYCLWMKRWPIPIEYSTI